MSAEANRKRHVEGELKASREQELLEENEKLLEEIARLRKENSDLKESRVQSEKKLEHENTLEDESGRKRRRIALDGEQQQQHVSQEDDAVTDAEEERTGEKEQDKNEPTVECITDLPPVLLGHALGYLTFLETRFFFACGNTALWKRRIEYDSRMMTDLVLPARPPYTVLRNNFINVCSLDLGPWCSNVVMAYMCDERVLPNLEHLAMARSIDVTDEGLALLPTNPMRCRKLKSLDLRYCRRTSFEQTVDIRKALEGLDVVKRLPPWLIGSDFVNGYVFKSWADGTYAYWNEDGSMNQCGYLCDLYENGSEDCVVTKAQPAFDDDDELWQTLPEWEFHAFRSGRTYLRTRDGQVLGAEPQKGIYPTNNFPRIEHANSVQMDYVTFFDKQGNECDEDDRNVYAKVQKYRFQPMDALMPPPEIVELCRAQLNTMHRVMAGRDQEQDERQQHMLDGGEEGPPPEWFQYYP